MYWHPFFLLLTKACRKYFVCDWLVFCSIAAAEMVYCKGPKKWQKSEWIMKVLFCCSYGTHLFLVEIFFFFFFLNAWPVEDFLHSSLWHFFKERFIIRPLRTQMKDVYYPACQHLVFVLVHDNFEVVQIQWNCVKSSAKNV